MLPENSRILLNDNSSEIKTTRTYKISGGKIVGFIDDKEALKQSIEICLRTVRHSYAIYSYDYGHELDSLMNLEKDLIKARAKSRIEEALLMDERIIAVEDVKVDIIDRSLYLSFEVKTIYGNDYYKGVV